MAVEKSAQGATKEITVVAPDRVGLIADVSEALAESNVNIDSISAESSAGNAIIRIIVAKAAQKKAAATLEKAGFHVVESNMLVVELPDKPGELARVSRRLAENGIGLKNVFILEKERGKTILALKVSDYDAAKALLETRP